MANVAKKKKFKNDDLVTVVNNTSGTLIYKSKRTGGEWIWDHYGAEDQMEIYELISMKSSYPTYFKEQWVRIPDEDVVEFLRVGHYFKDEIVPEDLDNLFDLDADQIESVIDKSTNSVKALIVGKARELFEAKKLRDYAAIKMLERKLNLVLDSE